jgi:predicted deacetylase
MTARFLVRLDDACPSMARERWDAVEALLDECSVRPIVAIIPDNLDPELSHCAPDEGFWERARSWQAKGWTIAMHGFQHVLRPTSAKQYMPLHPRSEFAGLPHDRQAEKIRHGWAILESKRLTPTVWVAPAHSFDRTTLEALLIETTIRTVSDGVARDQYFQDGFHWLPQQLWSLVPKREGLWTVCLHPNTMTDADIQLLASRLRGPFAGAITAVDEVTLTERHRTWGDRIEAADFWLCHYFQRGIGLVKKLVRR